MSPALLAFGAVFARDLRLSVRHGAEALGIVGFFVVAVALFALGVGPAPDTLARIGPGAIWVSALLATMMGLERLFRSDFADGSLDAAALSPCPLWAVALAKTGALWLGTALPLVAVSPVLGLVMAMGPHALSALAVGLVLGAFGLCLIGGVGAALVLGARRTGVLTALLVLPLYVPVLIFGVGAVEAAALEQTTTPHLSFLAGYALAALALCPWAMAAALRQALE